MNAHVIETTVPNQVASTRLGLPFAPRNFEVIVIKRPTPRKSPD